jgi:hypothetical protein
VGELVTDPGDFMAAFNRGEGQPQAKHQLGS